MSVNEFPSILKPNEEVSLFSKYVLLICVKAPYFIKCKLTLLIPVKILSPTVNILVVLFVYVASSKLDQIIMDNAIIVPLYYDQVLRFSHKNINGFYSNEIFEVSDKPIMSLHEESNEKVDSLVA